MLHKRGKFLSSSPYLPSAIISQFIWFNIKMQIDKTRDLFSSMSDKALNFVVQLLDRDGKLKVCECLICEFTLTNSEKFKLFQIIHALPKL